MAYAPHQGMRLPSAEGGRAALAHRLIQHLQNNFPSASTSRGGPPGINPGGGMLPPQLRAGLGAPSAPGTNLSDLFAQHLQANLPGLFAQHPQAGANIPPQILRFIRAQAGANQPGQEGIRNQPTPPDWEENASGTPFLNNPNRFQDSAGVGKPPIRFLGPPTGSSGFPGMGEGGFFSGGNFSAGNIGGHSAGSPQAGIPHDAVDLGGGVLYSPSAGYIHAGAGLRAGGVTRPGMMAPPTSRPGLSAY